MKRASLFAAVITVLVVSVGCGGGGGGKDSSGRATIAIQWPEPGRLIPKAANFVKVRALSPGATDAPAVPRPALGEDNTSQITIDNLPVGATVVFLAEAFAQNPDLVPGQTPQASGQQAILIRWPEPNTFDISMASTVNQIAVFRGATELTGPLELLAGEDAALSVQARDSGGAMVLVAPENWTWNSGSAALRLNTVLSVTGPTATARAHDTIQADINIQEAESNTVRALTVNAVDPLYPGFVDEALADEVTGVGDIAAGPIDTKAPGDRVWVTETRGNFRVVDTLRWEDLTAVGTPFIVPLGSTDLARNSRGIAVGRSTDFSTTQSDVSTFRDDGSRVWQNDQLGMLAILDITARKGFTYVLQDGPGVGFRVTKLRDDTGAIVKQFLTPPGFTPFRLTADDEGNLYFLTFENSSSVDRSAELSKYISARKPNRGATRSHQPVIFKMSDNAESAAFIYPAADLQYGEDLDFDQGLIYVLQNNDRRIQAFGQDGALVQTIPFTIPDTEFASRLAAFDGALFTLNIDFNGRTADFAVRSPRR